MPTKIIKLRFSFVIIRVLNGNDTEDEHANERIREEMYDEMHKEIAAKTEDYEIDKCTYIESETTK